MYAHIEEYDKDLLHFIKNTLILTTDAKESSNMIVAVSNAAHGSISAIHSQDKMSGFISIRLCKWYIYAMKSSIVVKTNTNVVKL